MGHFVKKIEVASGDYRTFEFKRIYTINGLRYYVMASDNSGRPHMLHLDQIGQNWKISNRADVPKWFLSIEKELEAAIVDRLKKSED